MAISKGDEKTRVRNLIGYWFLGLCNNFAYIVMLAAAGDILDTATSDDDVPALSGNSTTYQCIGDLKEQKCSPVSTGAILLADILPTLIVKTTAPFLIRRIPFGVRHLFIIAGQLIAFVTVAFSTNIFMGLTGVVIASTACGLGDITFLPMASHFPSYVISTWSSGTGASGLIGSTTYAVLTDPNMGHFTPNQALLMMTVIPVVFAVMFWGVLKKPATVHQVSLMHPSTYLVPDPVNVAPCPEKQDVYAIPPPARKGSKAVISLKEKLVLIKPLLKFMVPLAIVYFAEYFINQGLMELVVFNCLTGLGMSPRQQYRWYQVLYQIGVFLSRTSISLFVLPVKMLPVLAVLQVANAIFFSFEATNRFIPHILIVFSIVLFEGSLGGSSYANTFNAIHTTSSPETREFSMGFATLSDAIGIALAGTLAIPTHNAICTRFIRN